MNHQSCSTGFLRIRLHQCQRERYENIVMKLAILFTVKIIDSFENGLQPHSRATLLFSIRIVPLASLQSCRSVDAYAW